MQEALLPEALREILRTGRVRGRTRELPVMGGSSANNLTILARLLQEKRPTDTMEIGLACGVSALVFVEALRHAGSYVTRKHVAVDPYQADLDDSALVQIENGGYSDLFEFHREPSFAALPKLLENGRRFDVIYIDGSHHFEDVFIDIFYSAQLLRDGGIVLLDDSTWPDVKKAIAFVRANLSQALSEINLSPYRNDGGKSLKYRAAKALGRTQMTAFLRIGPPGRAPTATMKDF